MQRWIWFALTLVTMSCGQSGDDAPPISADATTHVDAATSDAPSADAYAGECAPERTRQVFSLIAAVPTCSPYEAEPIAAGGFCDEILTYGSTPQQRKMIEAAAPGFVCETTGYCYFSDPEPGTGIDVTADVMGQICAASLVVEAGCYIDCLVFI